MTKILLGTALVLGAVQLAVAYGVYIERRLLGRIQHRIGPNRVGFDVLATLPGVGGWFGFLRGKKFAGLGQPIADGIKLLLKEDIVPAEADGPTYRLAPYVGLVTGFAAFALVPFAPGVVLADLEIALLAALALGSLSAYAVVLAGWSSNSKYALLGGMRATAQLLSYELPHGLALLTVALTVESLRLTDVVASQSGVWFVFVQPLAFVVALLGAVAETNRAPFDLPEAEAELVAGYHTEYSGMRFALFFLAEYAHVFLASALLATVFLGGYHPLPFLPAERFGVLSVPVGFLSLLVKIYLLFFVFIWFRGTFPRLRYDQLMALGWKVLLPLALANLAVTAAVKMVFA